MYYIQSDVLSVVDVIVIVIVIITMCTTLVH